MDYRTVTALALRLTGVAVLVMTLPYAPSTFMRLFHEGATSLRQALLLTAFAELIPLLVGLSLIYFPARLSALIVGAPSDPMADKEGDRLGEVAAVAVGIYFFASGFFDLIYYLSKYWLFHAFITKDEMAATAAILQDDFAGLISVAVQLVVGLVLAMKARTLYGWLRRVRETRPKNGS